MKSGVYLLLLLAAIPSAWGQLQVDLKFNRLHYIAHEPVVATVKITNLAGRDITLQNGPDQKWFGFEIKGSDGHLLPRMRPNAPEPVLQIKTGSSVTRKINLTPLFPLQEFGPYHVRAHIYLADSEKFYYTPARVFQVADGRPIWQRTVGVPDGQVGAGESRTYSLLSGRFPDHTSLYVRVENRDSVVVRATRSLGPIVAALEPQSELDRQNQLHVLHCTSPGRWAYSHVTLNGKLLEHSIFMETRNRPRLRRSTDGSVAVSGGRLAQPGSDPAQSIAPRMSMRRADSLVNDRE